MNQSRNARLGRDQVRLRNRVWLRPSRAVIFSALTSVTLLLFLERVIHRDAALWGGLLFSAIPVEVYFGRTVQPEALSILCMILSWLALDRWLTTPPCRQARRAVLWGVATLCVALAVGQKLPYAHLLVLSVVLVWFRSGLKGTKEFTLWLHVAVSLVLVIGWYLYAHSAERDVVPTSFSGLSDQLGWGPRLPYYFSFQTRSRLPEIGATYTGLILMAIGAWSLRKRREGGFLGIWWLMVWGGMCLQGAYAFIHEYTALLWAPVNSAWMGVGVCALKDRAALLSPRADRAARIVLVFLILAVPVHAALRIKHWYRLGYPHLVRAETVSNQISDRGDLFLCNDYSAFVSLYHLHRRGWGFDFERTVPARIDEVESIVRQGARFLFTAKNGVFRDPGHFWSQTFRRFPVAYEDDNILVFKLAPSNEESAR